MVRVSVVIPTYNRADVVGRAVDSALSQTLTDMEVLVIDDGSTDDTRARIGRRDDDRLEYVAHERNRGGSAARNTGIDSARGEYVAFLDSDDEWHPTKLERQVDLLEERSEDWGGVYCGFRRRRTSPIAQFLDSRFRHETGREGDEDLLRALLVLEFDHGGASTLLIRSSVLEELNGFDESFQRQQDWEFLVRFLRQYKLAHVAKTLVTKHETGLPSLETVRTARVDYLRKYASEVVRLELDGYPVVPRHRFSLAKIAFANGRFGEGLSLLRRSSAASLRDYLGLGRSIIAGIT